MDKDNKTIVEVTAESEGMRLDQFLTTQNLCADDGQRLSRSALSRAIAQGNITVNNHVVKSHYSISARDVVTIVREVFAVHTALVSDAQVIFDVIYESDAFIIINKPAGLLVHPVRFEDTERTLVHGLIARYPEIVHVGDDMLRPGIVHRLDRETSGVMVIARSQVAFDTLKQSFQKREVQKTYYAITYGQPKKWHGVIDFPIARSTRGDRWRALRTERDPSKGTIRTASTQYTVQCSNNQMSVICAKPQTGRTHQIRVHLHALGCPIVGDTLYKHRGCISSDITRHALHAATLRFFYEGHLFLCAVPLPQDMQKLQEVVCKSSKE